MKILYLGEIDSGQTALMRMRALERLGNSVRGVHTSEPWKRAPWVMRQLQRRTHRGSVVAEINNTILSAARQFKPAVVWADKQEFLRVETIEELRSLGAKTIHFTPDPYFSLDWKRTRLMDEAMRAFDALVYCKSYEREQYEGLGKPVVYMPLGYCDEVHRPLASGDARWSCAVGFLGGWEPRRERFLHAVTAAGIDLKIWGDTGSFCRTVNGLLADTLFCDSWRGKISSTSIVTIFCPVLTRAERFTRMTTRGRLRAPRSA